MLNFIVRERPEVVIDIVGIRTNSRVIIKDVEGLLRRYNNFINYYTNKPEEVKKFRFLAKICKAAQNCSCKSVEVIEESFHLEGGKYYCSHARNIPASLKITKAITGETIRFEFPDFDKATRFREKYLEELNKFNKIEEVD